MVDHHCRVSTATLGNTGLIDYLELHLNGWIHNICSYKVRHLVLDQVGFSDQWGKTMPTGSPFLWGYLFITCYSSTFFYTLVFCLIYSLTLWNHVRLEYIFCFKSCMGTSWCVLIHHLICFKGAPSGYCRSYKLPQIWQLSAIPIIISLPLWVRSYDGLGQVCCCGPQNLKLMTAELPSQLAGVKRPFQGCSHCGQTPVPLLCIDGLHVSWVAVSQGGSLHSRKPPRALVTCPSPPLNQ